jgi:intergrase/recombinase
MSSADRDIFSLVSVYLFQILSLLWIFVFVIESPDHKNRQKKKKKKVVSYYKINYSKKKKEEAKVTQKNYIFLGTDVP